MKVQLAIFLKAPRPGQVKTRLAREVGDTVAVRIYREMAEHVLRLAVEAGYPTVVWYAPVDAKIDMRQWIGDHWDLRPQASGDLGERMAAAARAVPDGEGWICVGGDCPSLAVEHLRHAAAVLEAADVVLGPASDGGYYLVGGRVPLPNLMKDMPWSTERLMEATRRRLTDLRVSWAELPILGDVDTAADARLAGLLT